MKNIIHHRHRHTFHGKAIRTAKARFAGLVRPWVEAAIDDETRRARLWAASRRAVEMGLWTYPVRKQRSRETCYAILRLWCKADAPEPFDSWFGFRWHNWLHSQGWHPCGDFSDKYAKAVG